MAKILVQYSAGGNDGYIVHTKISKLVIAANEVRTQFPSTEIHLPFTQDHQSLRVEMIGPTKESLEASLKSYMDKAGIPDFVVEKGDYQIVKDVLASIGHRSKVGILSLVDKL